MYTSIPKKINLYSHIKIPLYMGELSFNTLYYNSILRQNQQVLSIFNTGFGQNIFYKIRK